jgi:MYXO-CTERM domain-containing protein
MMSRILTTGRVGLACAVLAVSAISTAMANGRPPGTSSIKFRTGNANDLVVGLTWGLVISHDGGQTFEWFCEDAVPYAGIYDPDYEYLADGTLLATTFDGLMANRSGCTFDRTPLAAGSNAPLAERRFISTLTQGPTGTVFAADASALSGGKIYRSVDGAKTFPVATVVGKNADWWSSIEVAPGDAKRVYVAGYRLTSGQPRAFLLFKSTDEGLTYQPLPTTAFTTSDQSAIDIVGISKTDPNLLFARVSTPVAGSVGEDIYRSADGGATWTKVYSVQDLVPGFVIRSNGDIFIGTRNSGSRISTDGGVTFTALATSLSVRCAVEAADGSLWACAQNQDPDFMAVAKSSNASSWSKVYQFGDTKKPVACAAGTLQFDRCQQTVWCGLVEQLGLTSTAVDCSVAPPMSDAGGVIVKPPMTDTSCCSADSPNELTVLSLAGVVGLVLRRRRAKN